MGKRTCVLGCPPGETLYGFPSKGKEDERRNKWLNFFDLEEQNTKCLYACALHFSNKQKIGRKMSRGSVPDVINNSESRSMLQKNPYLSICKSSSSQTNTSLCGLVQISNIPEEYHLNCFYCCETFPLNKWLDFIYHLKQQHFKEFQTFETFKYSDETEPKLLETIKIETLSSNITEELKDDQLCSEEPDSEIKLIEEALPNRNDICLDPLDLNNIDSSLVPENVEIKHFTNKSCSSSRPKNRIIPKELTIRRTPMRMKHLVKKSTTESVTAFLDDLDSCSKTSLSIAEEGETIASKLIKINNQLEARKQRPLQRVIGSGIFYIKDIKNNTITAKQSSGKTALNRCLKRANTMEHETLSPNQIFNTTELVFEFTPRDIMVDFLDNIKNYPILWEFHMEPNNKEYDTTIAELCLQFNNKWSLNLTELQMRRSINRILSFYRYMLPCEKVIIFADYYQKCCEFLPSSEDEIPNKRCEYCDICYANATELRYHLEDKHNYLNLPFKCDHCPERFRKKDELEVHKHLPHYMEIFRCRHCQKRFNHRHVLKRHLKIHEPSPAIVTFKMYKCDECDKEFKNSSELASHKIYHEEKTFQCHLCPKSYFRKLTLTAHLKRHQNQLDYICEVCGKAFLKKPHLNDHMEKHTGEKVTCNICNMRLKKSSLYRHLRLIHVAYEGTIESTFRSKGYHYKKHIKPYSKKYAQTGVYKSSNIVKEDGPRNYDCKKCNVHFDRLKLLKDHNNELHPDVKTVYCKICKRDFRHKPNLKRHYRDKHKLHKLQIIKLLHHNDDLDKILNLEIKDLSPDIEADYYSMIMKNDYAQQKAAADQEDHLVND